MIYTVYKTIRVVILLYYSVSFLRLAVGSWHWPVQWHQTGAPSTASLRFNIWDICRTFPDSRDILCNHEDSEYFNNQIIEVARSMMMVCLITTLIGLAVMTIGTSCWTNTPRITLEGLSAFLIFCSEVLVIIPMAWYNNILVEINAPDGILHHHGLHPRFSTDLWY